MLSAEVKRYRVAIARRGRVKPRKVRFFIDVICPDEAAAWRAGQRLCEVEDVVDDVECLGLVSGDDQGSKGPASLF